LSLKPGDDDFAEDFRDELRGGEVERAVDDDDAAEGRLPVVA